MFGFLYALFMGGACAVDEAKKTSQNMSAKEISKATHGWAYGNGKSYYDGYEAEEIINQRYSGEHKIKDVKTGKIIKDLQKEEYASNEERNQKLWEEEIEKAKGRMIGDIPCNYFLWTPSRHPSDRRSWEKPYPRDWRRGLYELSTLKRIYIMSFRGKHYKYYYSVNTKYESKVDWDSEVQLSEDEWWSYGGYWEEERYL